MLRTHCATACRIGSALFPIRAIRAFERTLSGKSWLAVQRLGPRPWNAVRPVVRAGTGGRSRVRGWARIIPNGCCRARPRGPAQRGQPGSLELVDQSCGRHDQVPRDRLVPRRHEWRRPPAGLAQERRRGSPGDHGEPLRARAPGFLGRTETPKPRLAHRFLRLAADAAMIWRRCAGLCRCYAVISNFRT